MDESILASVKKRIGLSIDDDSFDTDLIVDINSSVDVLRQIGLDVDEDFYVDDYDTTWADLLPSSSNLAMVKTYIVKKIRKWFDPPQNGTAMDALNSSIDELEWRINVEVDTTE